MSNVRKYFVSRFDGGNIVEADYSQLEVIYLAHVTSDPVLKADIEAGLDMHLERAAQLFRVPKADVTKEQRRAAKSLSFMLQYGAGPKHMAHETGLDIELCKQFISDYYDRYDRVKAWQDAMIDLVNEPDRRVVLARKSPGGYQLGSSTIKSETGRRYTFIESDSPEWMRRRGKHTSFKPTEIKNYPIQGGATGDIVPLMLGKLNRWIVENDYTEVIKLVATVHDSIVLDVHPEHLNVCCSNVKRIMESAPEEYEDVFGVKFDMALPVGIDYGPNWAECTTEWK
jgi:DNA polymerase-1